jgi:hypothetical protein
MRIVLTIIAALAAVTFPIYFIVYLFQALALGLMTLLVWVIWLVSNLFMKLNIIGKQNKSTDTKLIKG